MSSEPCRDYEGLLARAADGAIDAAARATLDRHLAGCPRCREALEGQILVHRIIAGAPAIDLSRDLTARVLAAIGAPRSWLDTWDFRQWTWRLAPIAMLLGLAAAGVVGWTNTGDASESRGDAGATVPAALWSDAVSDTSVLSLMIHASADDPLANHLKDQSR